MTDKRAELVYECWVCGEAKHPADDGVHLVFLDRSRKHPVTICGACYDDAYGDAEDAHKLN